jgi:hypothetical protein
LRQPGAAKYSAGEGQLIPVLKEQPPCAAELSGPEAPMKIQELVASRNDDPAAAPV